jgi:hypothetical protein
VCNLQSCLNRRDVVNANVEMDLSLGGVVMTRKGSKFSTLPCKVEALVRHEVHGHPPHDVGGGHVDVHCAREGNLDTDVAPLIEKQLPHQEKHLGYIVCNLVIVFEEDLVVLPMNCPMVYWEFLKVREQSFLVGHMMMA